MHVHMDTYTHNQTHTHNIYIYNILTYSSYSYPHLCAHMPCCISAAPRDSKVTSESWTSLSSAVAIFLGKKRCRQGPKRPRIQNFGI